MRKLVPAAALAALLGTAAPALAEGDYIGTATAWPAWVEPFPPRPARAEGARPHHRLLGGDDQYVSTATAFPAWRGTALATAGADPVARGNFLLASQGG